MKLQHSTIKRIDLPFLNDKHLENTDKFLVRKETRSQKKVQTDITFENISDEISISSIDLENVINTFKTKVKQGPEYVCSSCSQLSSNIIC